MNFEEDELKEGDEDPEFTGSMSDDGIDDDFVDDDIGLTDDELSDDADDEEESDVAADL